MSLRVFRFRIWANLEVDDIWYRGVKTKLLCLKEFSREEVRKGIVLFMNLKLKTKSIVCRQEKTCLEIRF